MLTIKGIYGREMYETWYKMTVLLQSGLDIQPVITHRFSYKDFEAGLSGDALRQQRQGDSELGGASSKMLGAYQQHVESQLWGNSRRGTVEAGARARFAAAPRRASCTAAQNVLVLCANNYLGLADDPRVIAAARAALDRWGYGMASVRFICGTQEQHKELEHELSELSRHGRHHSLFVLLRRQRRTV